MPIYDYWCSDCKEVTELNVRIDDRENQYCQCGNYLVREITFKGVVWAPTSGGMK